MKLMQIAVVSLVGMCSCLMSHQKDILEFPLEEILQRYSHCDSWRPWDADNRLSAVNCILEKINTSSFELFEKYGYGDAYVRACDENRRLNIILDMMKESENENLLLNIDIELRWMSLSCLDSIKNDKRYLTEWNLSEKDRESVQKYMEDCETLVKAIEMIRETMLRTAMP